MDIDMIPRVLDDYITHIICMRDTSMTRMMHRVRGIWTSHEHCHDSLSS